MMPSIELVVKQIKGMIKSKGSQGHVIDGFDEELERLAPQKSYDALMELAQRLVKQPMRPDWKYVEPDDLLSIQAESDPKRALRPLVVVDPVQIAPRVEAAFLSSVAGCILGKPIEGWLDLPTIRSAAEKVGAWPLNDYITEAMLEPLAYRHPDWPVTVRERITFVAPDDDINYSILGMLLLEKHGLNLERKHLADAWIKNLATWWCWGPERVVNISASLWSMHHDPEFPFYDADAPYDEWVSLLNPHDEFCGALIRADAYGYACAGNPALASELAWRDASFTHTRTGIYGTMFTAAAIAAAFVVKDPLEIFRIAGQYVPQNSRFADAYRNCLKLVETSSNWLEGYERVHNAYGDFGNCRIYQEIGTVMNTLRFAKNVGEGICMQVSQGNDTDSFGCTCGSILGAFHEPGSLEPRWLQPFNNTIHSTLATFQETRLSAVAERMGKLPALMAKALEQKPAPI